MKRAYVVVGAESSGNRMLTACLIRAGCYGHARTSAKFNTDVPTRVSPVAITRSFPHGGITPDLAQLVTKLEASDYGVTFVVVVRDVTACARSQVAREHQPTITAALAAIQRAHAEMWAQLGVIGAPVYVTTYEAITDPPGALLGLLDLLGLEPDVGPIVVEGVVSPLENRNHHHYGVMA